MSAPDEVLNKLNIAAAPAVPAAPAMWGEGPRALHTSIKGILEYDKRFPQSTHELADTLMAAVRHYTTGSQVTEVLSRIAVFAGWCADNSADNAEESRFRHVAEMAQERVLMEAGSAEVLELARQQVEEALEDGDSTGHYNTLRDLRDLFADPEPLPLKPPAFETPAVPEDERGLLDEVCKESQGNVFTGGNPPTTKKRDALAIRIHEMSQAIRTIAAQRDRAESRLAELESRTPSAPSTDSAVSREEFEELLDTFKMRVLENRPSGTIERMNAESAARQAVLSAYSQAIGKEA